MLVFCTMTNWSKQVWIDVLELRTFLPSIQPVLFARSEEQRQKLCLDKGYDYDEIRELGKEFGYTLHIRARKEEAKAIKREAGFRARRWVVERTHSWMNRFRAVLIRWDKKVENYLALLHLVCAFITYRAVGLLG